MGVPDQRPISAEDFLVWAERQDERYELVGGTVVRMMAGAKQSHAVVASNILVALAPQAKRGGCRTTASDTAVRTGPLSIRYPDIVVDCGPPDPSSREASRPTVVIEISSPRTSAIDVTDKLEEYQALGSVQAILLVDPDVVSVKIYRRAGGAGIWSVERLDAMTQTALLPELDARLALSDIYDSLAPDERPRLNVVVPAGS